MPQASLSAPRRAVAERPTLASTTFIDLHAAPVRTGLGNLAARTADQLAAIVRNRLKRIQYQPALIDGFLAQTGLNLEPEPP